MINVVLTHVDRYLFGKLYRWMSEPVALESLFTKDERVMLMDLVARLADAESTH